MRTSLVVDGPESSVEKFRSQLLADLEHAGVPSGSVHVSAPKPTVSSLTEPAPLGHVEWVTVAVTIAQSVTTAGLTEVVKALIKKHLSAHKLKSEEAEPNE